MLKKKISDMVTKLKLACQEMFNKDMCVCVCERERQRERERERERDVALW